MTDRDRRRQLRDQLRATPPPGGVVVLRHAATGRWAVLATENLQGFRNRFEFAQGTGSFSAVPNPALAADARAHGMDGLSLEVLEEVPVEAGADSSAIRDDLDTLAELWRERLRSEGWDGLADGSPTTGPAH